MRITGGEIRQVEKEKQKKQDNKKRAIIEAPGEVSDSQPNAVVFPQFCFLMPEPLWQQIMHLKKRDYKGCSYKDCSPKNN